MNGAIVFRAITGRFRTAQDVCFRNKVEFLVSQEQVHNPDFNYGGFATIRSLFRLNSCKPSVKDWVA